MILCLGFPDFYMDALEIGTHDSNCDICIRNTSSSRSHRSVIVSNRMWRLTTNIALQEIWIEIRADPDMQRCSVGLKKGNKILRLCGRSGWAR